MAFNPLVAQGTLNRLRGSVSVTTNPILNVTAAFLGKEGIGLSLEGETTLYVPTMTGAVTSPEPYQMVKVTMHLLKTQALSNQYKTQMETMSTIGDLVVTPDASTLGVYNIANASIQSIEPMKFSGEDAGFMVTLGGYYLINAAAWSLN